ncbi:MAG TPA: glycosyltransferase family 39 protein [Candidatus Paceibacterota bacterium]|nr:glycosyltransferase family 39 protein [Candidatus Paceibacterota bacterium]
MKLRLTPGRFAVLIVVIALLLAGTSSINDAPIVDEVPHIGAGYSYVTRLDFRLNPEHPPLVKDLAGLFLVPLDLNDSAFSAEQWTSEVNGQWTFGRDLIFRSGVSPDTVKTLARLPMLGLLALFCWMIWKWTNEQFGTNAAVIAVLIASFSPTVLAHGRFVTTDLGAGLGVMVATYWFLKFLRAPSRKTGAWAAGMLGVAFLMKFNTVLLGPFFMLTAALFALQGKWRSQKNWYTAARLMALTAGVGAASVLLVVWPVYIVQTAGYPVERQVSDTATIMGYQADNPLKSAVLWMSDKPVIRALGHWTLGLAMVAQRSIGGNTIYWLGQVVKQGGPWYFPIVYILKEPLAWWILVAFALASLPFHHKRRGTQKPGSWWVLHADEWAMLLWMAIYWAVSVKSTLNIGVRHLLPVFPFAIILVAGRIGVLLDWLRAHDKKRLQWFSIGIAVLLGWFVFESVRVWPSYLSYFNQIAGGPSGGYQFVTDSNLDWGQDLKRLGQFVESNDIDRICVDYFGWSDPAAYVGTHYVYTRANDWKNRDDFVRRNRCDGWLAISATFLQNANGQRLVPTDWSRTDTYRWLLDDVPVTTIGNSIFVWHVTK